MNSFNSMNRNLVSKKNRDPVILWSGGSAGSDFNNWTNSGCTVSQTVGNPAPSISSINGNYCYINLTTFIPGITTVKGRTITVNINTTITSGGVCDFFFGCNISGAGQMVRINTLVPAGEYSGLASTTSWTTRPVPSTAGPAVLPNIWYSVVITINASGLASYTWNGSATGTTTMTIANNGTYIGIASRASSNQCWVDNISIV